MASGSEGGDLVVVGGHLPDWHATVTGDPTRIEPGRQVDVRIVGGDVAEVEPGLGARRGEDALYVPGAVILPGLHDHHLHLRALIAGSRSASVGPEDVSGLGAMGAALREAAVDETGWRRAVGYHESVAGRLDRTVLDALVPHEPVRVQHRSGAMWIVNSAGIDVLGLSEVELPGVERDEDGRPNGRLYRLDRWMSRRLAGTDPVGEPGEMSRQMAARGITGVTDATPDATAEGVAGLVGAVQAGKLLQRLHVMCPPAFTVPAHRLVSRGPLKVLLDEDHLPPLEEIAALVGGCHAAGSPVAVHCVTAAQLALAAAAFDAAGSVPGDRIEHGSVIKPGFLGALARLGLTVVTNPGFVHSRGDAYLEDVEPHDLPDLYRGASLRSAGVALAAGTDAPFGSADPWEAVRAAVDRHTRGGQVVAAAEAVSLEHALALFTGAAAFPDRPRRVEVGEPGDLCLLGGGVVPEVGQGAVLATVVDGRVVHGAG